MKKVITSLTLNDEELRKISVYPSNLEADLFDTKLAVQSPYIPVKIKGRLHIVASWVTEYKREGKTFDEIDFDKVVNGYINPFKEENLLEDVIKLDVESIQSVITFCNKYGLLGEKVNKFPNENSGSNSLSRKVLASMIESYDYFAKEIRIFQGLLVMYHDIIKPLKEQSINSNEYDLKPTIEEMEMKLKKGINLGLGLVRPAVNIEFKAGFIPSYTTSSLLGSIYFHFYEMVTQGKQFNTCLNCGSLFIPRKANAKFCPPPYSGVHSSCQNSYNQMKSRARKAVKSGKRSIEEIAISLGRPLNEIRGWFN